MTVIQFHTRPDTRSKRQTRTKLDPGRGLRAIVFRGPGGIKADRGEGGLLRGEELEVMLVADEGERDQGGGEKRLK